MRVRGGRCGTGHGERRRNREGTGEGWAWRGEAGGTYVRNGARGRDEEEREGEVVEGSVWVGGNRMGMGEARRAVRNAARGRG